MTDKLTEGQRRALVLAVLLVAAGMTIGFASSFATLYSAARLHAWTYPALLPLGIDSGILAYVLLDHLAVTLGARSRWLHLVAWALAGFTVWANAAVSPAGGAVWRVIHAAMPALWVLGVEALRFTWRRLHDTEGTEDGRIPRARWIAAPWPTLKLWRRMKLANITSYERAAALEEARLHARDLLRAAREARPPAAIPAALSRAVRTGRLPASVSSAVDAGLGFGGASRWEPEVAVWVTSRLTLSDRLAAQLRDERQAITAASPVPVPEITAGPVPALPAAPPEPSPPPVPRTAARPSRKPSRVNPRTASRDDLKAMVRDYLADHPGASIGEIRRLLSCGQPKAKALLAEVGSERPAHLAAVKSL